MKKVVFLIVFIFFVGLARTVAADDCDSIPSTPDQIQNKIDCLNSKVSALSSQANTLKNQINQFDAQIKLTTVKITQVEDEINTLGGRIDQLKSSLDSLTVAFSSRAVETYKMSRFENGFIYLFEAKDIGMAVERYHYLQKIQGADRDLIARLENAQNAYLGQKADQETLQKELQVQKDKLNTQKSAKNALLTATKSDEFKYQTLLSQAIAQRNAFQNFVRSQGGASILNNQTVHDSWGYYYNQRDSQWGNNFMGTSHLTMADYGCLATSVAMMATHFGHNISPLDIANTSSAFFSPNADTALLYWQFSVSGFGVNLTPHPKSQLDSLLSSGPVIVGLYSGPDHYIVLRSGSGGNYIMNDPFLENGGNRNFTDKYNVGNITQVFTTSFN